MSAARGRPANTVSTTAPGCAESHWPAPSPASSRCGDTTASSVWCETVRLVLQMDDERAQHPGRDAIARGRVDVAEQRQLRQQHTPMRAEAAQQALPVHRRGLVAHEVRDIAAVEALALHHECLGGNHLLD